MIIAESFVTRTLEPYPAVRRILAAAIGAVEPGEAVRRYVRREGDHLMVGGQNYTLADFHRIYILSLGKAAHAMASSLSGLLSGLPFRGLIIAKHAAVPPQGFEQVLGGHPVPNEDSIKAGKAALSFLGTINKDDLLICLVSGGGSALMTAPLPAITLTDLQALTESLLKIGARVDEINTLRRHLDQVKGGGVARLVSPAPVISLILSDVVGNPLEAIASGPTAPDPTTTSDALYVIEKYKLTESIPPSILAALHQAPDTPKPGDEIFSQVQNVLVGSNQQAAQAALEQAKIEGFSAEILGNEVQGEARAVSKSICRELRERTTARPFCLIAGGETTVTVHGHGRGGRNQELALACVEELSAMENVMVISLATDGEDGPTDSAGAVTTDKTMQDGTALRLDPQRFLDENDSYNYFRALDDLLKPGPTGTNVNDLIFAFAF